MPFESFLLPFLFDFEDKMNTSTWIQMFKKETVDIAKMDVNALSYTESANRMRKLLKTGKYTFLSAIFFEFKKNSFTIFHPLF